MSALNIDWDLLATHLKEKLHAKNLSIRAASVEIGCSPATLSRLLHGTAAPGTPDTEVLFRAVSWLRRSISDFQIGAVPQESSFADVEMHLRALPQLDEDAKDNLVAMVRALHDQYRLRSTKS